jgi:succinyldiaminopimelate transaminase
VAPSGFVPPPYPYERLDRLRPAADAHDGGIVDLSIGTPCDPPPAAVVTALGASNAERGYPPSIGTEPLRTAAAAWMQRRLGVGVDPATEVAACVGTKEFVGTTPQWLRLRSPDRDTVLYPAVSYPTYEMGATLAGCRAVPVPVDASWRIDTTAIDAADARRALCLWVNTPGNPAGGLDDLAAAAAWGREHGVPVLSDECYVEFTWAGERRSILAHGLDGVIALHSLSKRSNAAGLRAGIYAGDAGLVGYLREVRKHVGMLVPGPVQAAAVAAFDDDAHVEEQRVRYLERLECFAGILGEAGLSVDLPGGGFYLWVAVPGGDDWALTAWLAERGGCLVSPGELYGESGRGYVRVAVVQPIERLELVGRRLAGAKYEPNAGLV